MHQCDGGKQNEGAGECEGERQGERGQRGNEKAGADIEEPRNGENGAGE